MGMRRIPQGCLRSMSLFELKHGDRYVLEFYEKLKSLIDELGMHQHVVTDTAILRGYHQDLAVSKFLSGLSPSL